MSPHLHSLSNFVSKGLCDSLLANHPLPYPRFGVQQTLQALTHWLSSTWTTLCFVGSKSEAPLTTLRSSNNSSLAARLVNLSGSASFSLFSFPAITTLSALTRLSSLALTIPLPELLSETFTLSTHSSTSICNSTISSSSSSVISFKASNLEPVALVVACDLEAYPVPRNFSGIDPLAFLFAAIHSSFPVGVTAFFLLSPTDPPFHPLSKFTLPAKTVPRAHPRPLLTGPLKRLPILKSQTKVTILTHSKPTLLPLFPPVLNGLNILLLLLGPLLLLLGLDFLSQFFILTGLLSLLGLLGLFLLNQETALHFLHVGIGFHHLSIVISGPQEGRARRRLELRECQPGALERLRVQGKLAVQVVIHVYLLILVDVEREPVQLFGCFGPADVSELFEQARFVVRGSFRGLAELDGLVFIVRFGFGFHWCLV
ncbi:shortage in chiasmata 1, partial [Striga asiatica]